MFDKLFKKEDVYYDDYEGDLEDDLSEYRVPSERKGIFSKLRKGKMKEDEEEKDSEEEITVTTVPSMQQKETPKKEDIYTRESIVPRTPLVPKYNDPTPASDEETMAAENKDNLALKIFHAVTKEDVESMIKVVKYQIAYLQYFTTRDANNESRLAISQRIYNTTSIVLSDGSSLTVILKNIKSESSYSTPQNLGLIFNIKFTSLENTFIGGTNSYKTCTLNESKEFMEVLEKALSYYKD